MPVLKRSPNKGLDVMHKKKIMAQPERRQGYPRALVLHASLERIHKQRPRDNAQEKDYGTARREGKGTLEHWSCMPVLKGSPNKGPEIIQKKKDHGTVIETARVP
jgi:hypothetical protein